MEVLERAAVRGATVVQGPAGVAGREAVLVLEEVVDLAGDSDQGVALGLAAVPA